MDFLVNLLSNSQLCPWTNGVPAERTTLWYTSGWKLQSDRVPLRGRWEVGERSERSLRGHWEVREVGEVTERSVSLSLRRPGATASPHPQQSAEVAPECLIGEVHSGANRHSAPTHREQIWCFYMFRLRLQVLLVNNGSSWRTFRLTFRVTLTFTVVLKPQCVFVWPGHDVQPVFPSRWCFIAESSHSAQLRLAGRPRCDLQSHKDFTGALTLWCTGERKNGHQQPHFSLLVKRGNDFVGSQMTLGQILVMGSDGMLSWCEQRRLCTQDREATGRSGLGSRKVTERTKQKHCVKSSPGGTCV